MNNQIEWLKQIDKIHDGEIVICPACGSNQTRSSFVRFPNGIGYGDIICNECNAKIHISRMKFPENTKADIKDVK